MIIVLANNEREGSDECRRRDVAPYGRGAAIYTPDRVSATESMRLLPSDEIVDIIRLGDLPTHRAFDAMELRRRIGRARSAMLAEARAVVSR